MILTYNVWTPELKVEVSTVPAMSSTGESKVPSAGPVGFTERTGSAELIGDAGQFPYGPRIAELGVRILAVLVH